MMRGPFYQTRRFDRYAEVLNQLLAQGDAYHCYCSREELEEMRNAQLARNGEAALRRALQAPHGAGGLGYSPLSASRTPSMARS